MIDPIVFYFVDKNKKLVKAVQELFKTVIMDFVALPGDGSKVRVKRLKVV